MQDGVHSLDSKQLKTKEENLINFADSFAEELTLAVFSQLDIKDLATSRLVCNQWRMFADDKSIWRSRINLAFPYYAISHQELYQADPKKLYMMGHPFKHMYPAYQTLRQTLEQKFNEVQKFTDEEFIATLGGKLIRENDPDYDNKAKMTLRALAISNGFHDYLISAEDIGEVANKAIKYAIHVRNEKTVHYIITTMREKAEEAEENKDGYADQDYTLYRAHRRLFQAIKVGSLPIVQSILESADVMPIDGSSIKEAFVVAISQKHFAIADYIKTKLNLCERTEAINQSINNALNSDNLDALVYLFNDPGYATPFGVNSTFLCAVELGRLSMVEHFIKNYCSTINDRTMEAALNIALKKELKEIAICLTSIKSTTTLGLSM